MCIHNILLSSSYVCGYRIALDLGDCTAEVWRQSLLKIKEVCGKDVSLGAFHLLTDSPKWDSVPRSDPYWEGVRPVGTVGEFTQLIVESRWLPAKVVAQYILTLQPHSNRSLVQAVNRVYEQYLPDKLFDDKIQDRGQGLVADSMYEWLGDDYMSNNPIEMQGNRLAIRSRILFSYNGVHRAFTLDKLLEVL